MNGQSRINKLCKFCNNQFKALSCEIRKGGGIFCSPLCYRSYKSSHIKTRFNQYVSKENNNNECHVWLGSKTTKGYGKFGVREGGWKLAHRVSYELTIGPISARMNLCHKCDNSSCVNPDHLFIGTQKDNLQDMVKKGRALNGSANPRAKLTEEAVRTIRRANISQKELAKQFLISEAQVCLIRKRKSWKHLVD